MYLDFLNEKTFLCVFHFQDFTLEIQNQFDVSIKILHSDNACKYLSSQFCSFLTLKGILHETSCAHTPLQNGVAKRKNHHLVETSHTLILHYNVPHRLWGDALLTAYYLINCMPSFVLEY